jgi:hypothetical protein
MNPPHCQLRDEGSSQHMAARGRSCALERSNSCVFPENASCCKAIGCRVSEAFTRCGRGPLRAADRGAPKEEPQARLSMILIYRAGHPAARRGLPISKSPRVNQSLNQFHGRDPCAASSNVASVISDVHPTKRTTWQGKPHRPRRLFASCVQEESRIGRTKILLPAARLSALRFVSSFRCCR